MDVSFSAWRHSREESLQLKGESFSFLFDRRYTNRLNRMSRVFFEAYVVATKELAAQEDRFPSLSEIDAKMESGAVYAFKDRLMKNTEFFEEVKISGVSYLVPRALKFVDATGVYTDLILNFEEGAVVMPTRRKMPTPQEPEPLSSEGSDELEGPEPENVATEPTREQAEPAAKSEPETKPEPYPLHTPEAFEEIMEPAVPPAAATPPSEPTGAKVDVAAALKEPVKPSEPKRKIALRTVAIVLVIATILLAAAAIIFFKGPVTTGAPILVEYSAQLSNASNDSYLALDINDPQGMSNEMEMVLPPNIDQSISARGGTVTISHANNTLVRMNSSSDASIRIYLQGNWTTVPMSLSLAAPEGYDTSLVVHGEDYFVTRKDNSLVLRFNLTQEGVSFEQSYSPKR
jgi:outer membrane biosynthesis protein TonB